MVDKQRTTIIVGLIAVGLMVVAMVGFVVAQRLLQGRPEEQRIKALSPEVKDWSVIHTDFLRNAGDSDWYRVPVRYPFDLHCVDVLERGHLRENVARGRFHEVSVDTPEVGPNNVTHYATDGLLLLFRQQRADSAVVEFGMFEFASRRTDMFENETQLRAAATARGYHGATTLVSVADHFNEYWGTRP